MINMVSLNISLPDKLGEDFKNEIVQRNERAYKKGDYSSAATEAIILWLKLPVEKIKEIYEQYKNEYIKET